MTHLSICNEQTAFEKNEGAFGKNTAVFEGAFACICVHTLVRLPSFPVECTALSCEQAISFFVESKFSVQITKPFPQNVWPL